jgi:hypothetical protein
MLPDARALDIPTNLKLVVLSTTTPQISGTKVLQNLIPLELAAHFSQGNGLDFLSVAPAASVFVRLYQ